MRKPPAITINTRYHDRWVAHKVAWSECNKCPLHETRQNVVLLRGSIPADILFIGEAPGPSEDDIGLPFVGPAGLLLDDMLHTVFESLGPGPAGTPPSIAITNIVACQPLNSDDHFREPTASEAEDCRPRLLDLEDLVRPHLLVTLGNVAKKFLPNCWGSQLSVSASHSRTLETLNLVHPSYILRKAHNKPHEAALDRSRFETALRDRILNLRSEGRL